MSMTKDRARKRAIRAQMAETGESYTAASRRLDGSPAGGQPIVQARQLYADLVAELRRAGWPVEVEPRPQYGQYLAFPGPMQLSLGRAERSDLMDDDADPDDELWFDLTWPLELDLIAPSPFLDIASDGYRVEATLDGTHSLLPS